MPSSSACKKLDVFWKVSVETHNFDHTQGYSVLGALTSTVQELYRI